jgi:hypothetical protein
MVRSKSRQLTITLHELFQYAHPYSAGIVKPILNVWLDVVRIGGYSAQIISLAVLWFCLRRQKC